MASGKYFLLLFALIWHNHASDVKAAPSDPMKGERLLNITVVKIISDAAAYLRSDGRTIDRGIAALLN
jgi:hypothetical protein